MFGLSTVKMVVFSAVALAVIGLATKGLFFVTGLVAENKNLTESVSEYREQNGALEAQGEADATVIEAFTRAQVFMGEAITITNQQFSEIREIRDRDKRVLEGSRLGRLAADKADTIERLSNDATRNRARRFEGVVSNANSN